ncbi:unnamed protein product [Phyllotreta striolata]|uniref:Dehydrogenase/reductase SDR family member 4 n=1 Tax=Phyllotreta striolata TaxID=444603 RepID=A0A9N9XNW9_PHYSR|nr:unnamed protein product [Phyllotreta striolata]
MLKRLAGRVAIVTGSTKGIGYAIAERLAQEGAKVVVSSRKQAHVDEALESLSSKGYQVSGLTCHVAKKEDRQKLLEEASKLGGLDILVSHAGVNPSITNVFGCTEEAWDKIFDVNVKTAFLLAKESLPLLKNSKAGRIMYTSSVSAFRPFRDMGAYGVSKTALLGLVKAEAFDLGPYNITVNGIAPGYIETRFAEVLTPMKETYVGEMNIKRIGKPEDISGIAAFLASDDGAYITGETIVAAGGLLSRL